MNTLRSTQLSLAGLWKNENLLSAGMVKGQRDQLLVSSSKLQLQKHREKSYFVMEVMQKYSHGFNSASHRKQKLKDTSPWFNITNWTGKKETWSLRLPFK